MICAYILRKLPLYVSDDLTPRISGWVIKHLEHYKACRLELKMLQAFQSHLGQWVTPLPSKTLDGFTDEVMQHIARPTAIETTPDHIISTSLWSSFRHRFIFVGMFMVLSCFALVRQAFIDEMFILHQMKPSIVTRDGSIVSEAQFRGHKAAINVVKDRDGMVIIWLDAPAHKTKQERRSG